MRVKRPYISAPKQSNQKTDKSLTVSPTSRKTESKTSNPQKVEKGTTAAQNITTLIKIVCLANQTFLVSWSYLMKSVEKEPEM